MLRAGFADADITPDRDCSLLGYDYRQTHESPGNAGAHDPLLVRALALEDADCRAVLVALDLCITTVALARRLRAAVAERLGLPAAHVLIACSHTHSGPFLPDVAEAAATSLPNAATAAGDANARYAAALFERVAETAARAAGLTVPVAAGARSAALGLAYDRRVPAGDGVRHCWNPQEYPDLDPRPAVDPTCSVLVLRQLNGPRTHALWSFGAHPVALGKTSRVVSADWPGRACRLIDAQTGGRSLFALGACGDAHPWIATQEDAALLEPLAMAAAGLVASLAQAARMDGAPRLRVAARTLALGGAELDLAAWRICPALLVAAPVELFQALAVDLRSRIAGPVILATNTNGWTGYWPHRAAFAQGGYEVDGARRWGRQPGDGEKLIDALVEMAGTV